MARSRAQARVVRRKARLGGEAIRRQIGVGFRAQEVEEVVYDALNLRADGFRFRLVGGEGRFRAGKQTKAFDYEDDDENEDEYERESV